MNRGKLKRQKTELLVQHQDICEIDNPVLSDIDTNTYKFPLCYTLYSDEVSHILDPYIPSPDITNIIDEFSMVILETTIKRYTDMWLLTKYKLSSICMLRIDHVEDLILEYCASICNSCLCDPPMTPAWKCNLAEGCCTAKYRCQCCLSTVCVGCNGDHDYGINAPSSCLDAFMPNSEFTTIRPIIIYRPVDIHLYAKQHYKC